MKVILDEFTNKISLGYGTAGKANGLIGSEAVLFIANLGTKEGELAVVGATVEDDAILTNKTLITFKDERAIDSLIQDLIGLKTKMAKKALKELFRKHLEKHIDEGEES